MSHIAWKEGRDGSRCGSAGWTNLISIRWSSVHTDPEWVVESRIFLVPESLRGSDDLTEAEQMAEEAVTRWLSVMGAQWIPEGS